MRVHVISDMEGVAGIVKWEQTLGGEDLYDEGRVLYTEEINAAVRGARSAGATEIVVMDCHGAGKGWTFNSLLPELLDPGCDYVVQEHWTEYVEFLENGCDAALFVGMHARAGIADGVLNHTVSGQAWQNLWFNGQLVGETGIQAVMVAFSVPEPRRFTLLRTIQMLRLRVSARLSPRPSSYRRLVDGGGGT